MSSDRSTLRNIDIRPIRPDDWHGLQRLHERLSTNSILLRFHGAKRELSTPLAHHLADLDGHDNVAFVATAGINGHVVGVARYIRIGPRSAEVAFVVEDAYQGYGIGRRLMEHLVAAAQENGIDEFVAEVLYGNVRMQHLLTETGPTRTRHHEGVCEVRLDLTALGDAGNNAVTRGTTAFEVPVHT